MIKRIKHFSANEVVRMLENNDAKEVAKEKRANNIFDKLKNHVMTARNSKSEVQPSKSIFEKLKAHAMEVKNSK